jgi:hypothetical protein
MNLKSTNMKTIHSTTDQKDRITVSRTSKFKFIKLLVIGLIVAAGFSSCVVYAHPAHPYYWHHY